MRRGIASAVWVKARRNLTGHETAGGREDTECNAEATRRVGIAVGQGSRVAQATHEMQLAELHRAAGLYAGIAKMLAL